MLFKVLEFFTHNFKESDERKWQSHLEISLNFIIYLTLKDTISLTSIPPSLEDFLFARTWVVLSCTFSPPFLGALCFIDDWQMFINTRRRASHPKDKESSKRKLPSSLPSLTSFGVEFQAFLGGTCHDDILVPLLNLPVPLVI